MEEWCSLFLHSLHRCFVFRVIHHFPHMWSIKVESGESTGSGPTENVLVYFQLFPEAAYGPTPLHFLPGWFSDHLDMNTVRCQWGLVLARGSRKQESWRKDVTEFKLAEHCFSLLSHLTQWSSKWGLRPPRGPWSLARGSMAFFNWILLQWGKSQFHTIKFIIFRGSKYQSQLMFFCQGKFQEEKVLRLQKISFRFFY